MAHYKISATFLNSFLQNNKYHGFMDILLKKYSPSCYTEWGCYFEDFLDAYYHNPEAGFVLPDYQSDNCAFRSYVDTGKAILTEEIFKHWCKEIGEDTVWQEWMRKDIEVDGDTFTIIGKPDIYSRSQNRIMDLKTALRNPPANKYAESVQHPMYIWMTGIPHFDYLIHSRQKPDVIFKQSFEMEPEVAEEIIVGAIKKTMAYLNANPPLKNLFVKNFTLDPDAEVFRHR